MKTVIITGGSSGIGLYTAKALQKKGYQVYELSRTGKSKADLSADNESPSTSKKDSGDSVHSQLPIIHIPCDVSDEGQVIAAVETVKNALDQSGNSIDLLICNAGYGISGAAEFTDNADAKALMEVNLYGVVNCCKALVPIMRAQGKGRILCLSSVAGAIPIPFQTWYSVSKAAVLAYADALRNEVGPFGIEVGAVLPGDIATGFTAARQKNHVGDDIYQGRIAKSVAGMEHDEETGMTAEYAGNVMAFIATCRHLKPHYTIGTKYKLLMILAKFLPCTTVRWLVGILYG